MTDVQVDIAMADGAITLRLRGELDAAAGAVLRDCVDASDAASRSVIIDLSGVRFIDSGGIWSLVSIQRGLTLDFRRMEVVGAYGQVRRILEISGATALLENV